MTQTEAPGRLRTLRNETFGSFTSRNFRLFFVGQGISQIGNWMTLVAQNLLVLSLTHDGVMVGLMTAFQFAPVLFLGAWAGLVADRADKRKLLIGVQCFAMAQSFALASLAFMDSPPLWALYGVASLGGVAFAFDNPTRRAFVTEMVPEDLVHNAVSLNTAMMTSARVVGPAVAGLLITTVGFGWAFLGDGLSYIAVIVSLSLMRPSELRKAPVTPRGKGQVRQGLRYVRGVPDLWVPLMMMAVVGTLAFNFQVVFPLVVTRTFDSSEGVFTILFSFISLGSLCGALYTARRRTIEVADVVRASALYGLAMCVFAIVPNLGLAFAAGFLVGLASVGFLTASTAIVQVRADPSMRGRVLALQAIVFLGSTPIGGPIVGFVAQHAGPRWAVALGGVACFGAAAWGRWATRHRGLTDEPVEIDEVDAPADLAT